jgi:hypothetical protein
VSVGTELLNILNKLILQLQSRGSNISLLVRDIYGTEDLLLAFKIVPLWIQSTSCHAISVRPVLISAHVRLNLRSGIFPSDFRPKFSVYFSHLLCVLYFLAFSAFLFSFWRKNREYWWTDCSTILQHPVALCRSGLGTVCLVICSLLLLFFSLLYTHTHTHTHTNTLTHSLSLHVSA